MIEIQLRDGRVFQVDEVEFRVKPREEAATGDGVVVEETFSFSEVDRIACIDGGYEVMGARFGDMPIRVFRWTDPSDVRIDVPMPLEAARDLGEALQSASVIEVARTLPSQIVRPPGVAGV